MRRERRRDDHRRDHSHEERLALESGEKESLILLVYLRCFMLYFLYGGVVIDFVVERSPLFISSSPFFWRFHSNHLISFLLIFTHNSYKKNLLSMSKKISSQQEKREERERESWEGGTSLLPGRGDADISGMRRVSFAPRVYSPRAFEHGYLLQRDSRW